MEEKPVARLQEIINKFKQNFPPAEDPESSDHLLSTQEIWVLISNHDASIGVDDINLVPTLEKTGYKYEALEEDGEIAFKWLVRRV